MALKTAVMASIQYRDNTGDTAGERGGHTLPTPGAAGPSLINAGSVGALFELRRVVRWRARVAFLRILVLQYAWTASHGSTKCGLTQDIKGPSSRSKL
jgi:hypothetical protein